MRYVSLIKRENTSSYDTVIINGCGPNFVYNRRESFASMIKEQGVIFWFRFWLTFCFNPGCPYLKKLYRKWPVLKNFLNIQIHREFLEGSVEDAIRYCLAKAIMFLRTPVHNPLTKKKSAKAMLSELQDFTEMAFGAALCDVFCMWLKASEMSDKTVSYWQLPNHYLYLHFEPGRLEKFLVKQWDDFLLLLFDVNLKEIPWFLKVLYAQPCDISLNADNEIIRLCEEPIFQNMLEYMRMIRDQRHIKIQVIDELPIVDVSYNVRNLSSTAIEQKCVYPALKQLIANEPLHPSTQHVCAHCSTAIEVTEFPKFRLCKRCVEENCVEPRYYCNATCQIEHWFLQHYDEHSAMLNAADYRYPSTYGKDSINSFPFYPDTNPDLADDSLLNYRIDKRTQDDDEMHYFMLSTELEESPIFRLSSERSKALRTSIATPIACLSSNFPQIKSSRKKTSPRQIARLSSEPDQSSRSTSNPELTLLLKLRLDSDDTVRSELIPIPKMLQFSPLSSDCQVAQKQLTNSIESAIPAQSSDSKVPLQKSNDTCLTVQLLPPDADSTDPPVNETQVANSDSTVTDTNKAQEPAANLDSGSSELPNLELSESKSSPDSGLVQPETQTVDATESETKIPDLDTTGAGIKMPNTNSNESEKKSQTSMVSSGTGKSAKFSDPGKPPLPKSISNSSASKRPSPNAYTGKAPRHKLNARINKLSKPKSVTKFISF